MESQKPPEPKKWEGAFEVPITDVEANEWNPNQMSQEMLEQLVSEITKNGFDEPVIVVPIDGGKYRIVNGEHRYKAAQALGMATLPVVIKDRWDEGEQKIQTVRRNMLRGELDRVKFTKLVNDLVTDQRATPSELPKKMGFLDEQEFHRQLVAEKAKTNAKVAEMLSDTKNEVQMVDNLSYIVNEIFGQFGQTVAASYIFFMHKSRMHLMLQMDKDMEETISLMVNQIKAAGGNANDFLGNAINHELARIRAEQPATEKTTGDAGGEAVKYD